MVGVEQVAWELATLRHEKLFVNRLQISHHPHHVVPPARISLILSHHFSLSFIASGRSSGLHPVSLHSFCMYVRAGRPAFARPYVGVHRSTSLMSSSLLLQQCLARLVRLTWIVFVMGGRWPYNWCFVGCCLQDLFNIARTGNFSESAVLTRAAIVLGRPFLILLFLVFLPLWTVKEIFYIRIPWEQIFPICKLITDHFVFFYNFIIGQPIKNFDLRLQESIPFTYQILISHLVKPQYKGSVN